LDWQYSVIIENFLKEGLEDRPGPVLVIISFGMGLWIGGVITYKAFELAAQRNNLPVSIITPGINKKEIFNSLKRLSPQYGQTIFVGYPPFVKDIIDEAPLQGIDIDKLNIRMLFAAEAITEEFRDYVATKVKVKNRFLDTMSIYGSADIGAMAYEAGVSILIKRLAMKNPALFKDIFGNVRKTPTLAQFNPLYISFEEVDRELVLTGNSAMPLVRYAIGDSGGVFSYDDLTEKLNKHGINFEKELRMAGIDKNSPKLPFVYIYERNDFSVKLHLRDIHPQIIRNALLLAKISDLLTGKFTMATRYNNNQDQYLELNLEKRKGKEVNKKATDLVERTILQALYLNTDGPGDPDEFIKRPNLLKLVFWPAEDPTYFTPGIKQKWVKKEE
jgi:phenylacetate-CoA ligase